MDIKILKPSTVVKKSTSAHDVTLFFNGTSPEPYKCTLGYVHDGYAYVSTRVPNTLIDWNSQTPVCPAIDIAVVYDGSWLRTIERRYVLVNQGNCLVAIVDDTGVLKVYYDESHIAYVVIDTQVSKVSMVRGWKNTIDDTKDQGIVVAYIKNGECYYCCLQYLNGAYVIQQKPFLITFFEQGIIDVDVAITNDFRVVLSAIYTDKVTMSFSNRTWAGISGPQEVIKSTVDNYTYSTEHINSTSYTSDNNTIDTKVGNLYTDTHDNVVTRILNAETLDNTTLSVEFNTKLRFTDLDTFLSDLSITYKSVHTGNFMNSYAKGILSQNRRCVIFDITHIGNATGSITISYVGTSVLTGYDEVVTDMSFTFVGSNLTPEVVNPPTLINAINVGGMPHV